MVGDRARHVAVTQPQRLLEDVLHLIRQRRPGMIGLQVLRTPEKMLHAGLMRRVVELPIGCPSIPHENAPKVGPQQRRGLVEAPARINRIDGGTRRRGDPQPLQLGAHTPAGFLRRDHRTLPHGVHSAV